MDGNGGSGLAGWWSRHRFFSGVLAGVLLAWAVGSAIGEEGAQPSSAQPSSAQPSSSQPSSSQPENNNATVTHVVDGDTIDVTYEGSTIRVRLIGIDTPETVHPSEPVECFGKAASSFTTSRLDGKDVRLEFDVERLDRYGRTLAYVWLGPRLFNEVLARRGFASVSTYPPNVKYVDRFLAAQREARDTDAGLWGACDVPSPSPSLTPGPTGTCDPSYPDVCIPPHPPDLDCADVGASYFKVVGDDPHGFDGDGDGVGCES